MSVFKIDLHCCAALAITPFVDSLYHDEVDVLSLSELEIRRRALATFVNCAIVRGSLLMRVTWYPMIKSV